MLRFNLAQVHLKYIISYTISIYYSKCGMAKCPKRLGFVGAQLTCLNLSDNHLRVLPPEIGCLRGLQTLSLRNNQLRDLPVSNSYVTFFGHFSMDGTNRCSKC